MKRLALILLIFNFQFSIFNSTKAQDLYQIEQSFDHSFTVTEIEINSGWDVRLIQTPKGTPTQLIVTTTCPEFFEEGSEPLLMEVKQYKKEGWYELKENQWMPRKTKVEIYTSQPFDRIEIHKGARLTIQHYDFDSVKLDITADSGSILIIDTLSNPGKTEISVENATLDLRHIRGNMLKIWTIGDCHITEGDVQTTVPVSKELGKEWKIRYINLGFGLDLAMPVGFESNRYGSPYNTNFAFSGHIKINFNDIAINRRLAWNFGLDVSWNSLQLDNAVKTDGNRLVLDPSYGATPPRQSLYYWAVGLPVTMKLNFGKWSNPNLGFPLRGIYASLTPTLNFKPRLVTQSLDEDDHWNTDRERVDILSRFNVRAAIGVDCAFGGLGKVEFFVDLLPSFRSSADAPQTHMFGFSYIF